MGIRVMEKDKEFSEMLKDDLEKKSTINEKGEVFLKGVKDEIKIGKIEVDQELKRKVKEKYIDPSNKIREERKQQERVIETDELRIKVAESYEGIIEVLKYYCDLKEQQYSLIALWIIGTYIHDGFETYPYLFFNAMKGSGKTRTMKLIIALSHEGNLVLSPREAMLFRTKGTLGIDEFEGINRKGWENVRELLNAAYKKGIKVQRTKKVHKNNEETFEVEEFEPFRPIVMSNIWGMEEVLGDRCFETILEKSIRPDITKKIENFQSNPQILKIKEVLTDVKCSLCSVVASEGIYIRWNDYISHKHITTLYTQTTDTTLTTQTTPNLDFKEEELFLKIDNSNIDGRHLELALPLFLISNFINEDTFDKTLITIKDLIAHKKEDDFTESRDVSFIDFISNFPDNTGMISVKRLAEQFKEFIQEDESEEKWINSKWVGRALKRLGLAIDKRRVSRGTEVNLDIKKALKKMEAFR